MAKPEGGHKGDHGNAPEEENLLGEADLASDVMGNNQLQGDDQANVHNQRHAVPDAKLEADSGPVESAKMQDKDARARAELGKGGGVHPGEGSKS